MSSSLTFFVGRLESNCTFILKCGPIVIFWLIYLLIYLFIFCCAGSSLLHGLFSSCDEWEATL